MFKGSKPFSKKSIFVINEFEKFGLLFQIQIQK